jgi:hypothetical protein
MAPLGWLATAGWGLSSLRRLRHGRRRCPMRPPHRETRPQGFSLRPFKLGLHTVSIKPKPARPRPDFFIYFLIILQNYRTVWKFIGFNHRPSCATAVARPTVVAHGGRLTLWPTAVAGAAWRQAAAMQQPWPTAVAWAQPSWAAAFGFL